uniref:Uncharacterized protein n=1 Tax=Solanum tuberosum TaxID=4113 RepID=M1CDV2_SOLTU
MPLNKFELKNVSSNTPPVREVQVIQYLWAIYDSIFRLTYQYIFIRTDVPLPGDTAFLFHACRSRCYATRPSRPIVESVVMFQWLTRLHKVSSASHASLSLGRDKKREPKLQ